MKDSNETQSQFIVLRELNLKYQSFSKKERNVYYLSHKEYYNTVNNYILRNLLFYTVLLKEFIIAFCELNTFNSKDINFFLECLGKNKNTIF